MEDAKLEIVKWIAKALEKSENEIYEYIEKPKDDSLGDFAFPCFRLAKDFKKSPVAIAEDIKEFLEANKENISSIISNITVVNGYVNFNIDNKQIVKKVIAEVLDKKEKYILTDVGAGKNICIDYSSPNIAKPFHIGHLRSTVIGGAIYRLYKTLGYNVIGINYLGDFGTQFGYVIEGYKRFGNEEEFLKNPIKHLVDIYVKINAMAKEDEDIVNKARENFKLLEQGDKDIVDLWTKFRNSSLEKYQEVYDRLGVSFDSYNGESFYNDKMDEIVNMLKEKGLLVESEGAKVVNVKVSEVPCMILKSNGSTTYATRDLAAVLYRARTYDYYKSIYVTSYEQILHFNQVFEVAKNITEEKYSNGLIHVPFGMVLGPGGKKLSTRKGTSTTLEDIIDESVQKAKSILKEKGKVEDNIDEVADIIGVGAIIFNDLKNNRIKDEIYDLDEMLKFEGETGPYVQYTYVRINSILAKVKYVISEDIDYTLLKEKEEIELVKKIDNVKNIIKTAAEEYEPSILTRYVIDLASSFSRYYNEHKIISEDEQLTGARIALIYCVGEIIKDSMLILGIKCPNKM